jgi:thioesterase domain-containing protein
MGSWNNLTTEAMVRYEVPGTHTSIYHEPNVGVLATILGTELCKAQADAEIDEATSESLVSP